MAETRGGAKQFRKRPVVIWAFQYNGQNAAHILYWIGGTKEAVAALPNRLAHVNNAGDLLIRTLESGEGYHIADIGDYIIQGVKGEFYPCKPDIFEATYEEVSRG
jgi:hypothetical protein